MTSRIALVISGLLIGACSTPQLTPMGRGVVALRTPPVGHCQELGPVTGEGHGPYSSQSLVEYATNDARNHAAELGATHVLTTSPALEYSSLYAHNGQEVNTATMTGTAYRCGGGTETAQANVAGGEEHAHGQDLHATEETHRAAAAQQTTRITRQPLPSDVHPGVDFHGRDLTGARFEQADLSRANFSGANLTDTVFDSADLTQADFTGANLTGARFVNSTFTGANFTSVDFTTNVAFEAYSNGSVGGGDLSFVRVNFTGANLTGVTLEHADLTRANFTRAYLNNADLSRANLTHANFTHANLWDANLGGADLTSTNFTGVLLTNTRIVEVRCNATTRWPAHFAPPPCQ